MSETVRYGLSLIAGTLTFAGFVPYIMSIIRGSTEPMKVTWLIYSILDGITFAGMYAAGSLNGQVTGSMIGCLFVFALTLKCGKSNWTTVDVVCLVVGMAGLGLWYSFSDPVYAIVTSLGVVTVGSVPTFKSAWDDPGKENVTAWTIWLVASIFQICALRSRMIEDAAQPLCYFFVQAMVLLCVFLSPRRRVLR